MCFVGAHVVAARHEMFERAQRCWARDVEQLRLRIDERLAIERRHGVTTDNSEIHAAAAAVNVLGWLELVRQRVDGLLQRALVRTRVVLQPRRSHISHKRALFF